MLGSAIESALSTVGITPDRIERWVGVPCGCVERKEKLDALYAWAKRVVAGKVQYARIYLQDITGIEV